ncbi:hypothetical protein HWV62_31684 [Athelia sp. TMB]|nr:hypothetical protein HWV62_31684 [Athelia sp. TMB]
MQYPPICNNCRGNGGVAPRELAAPPVLVPSQKDHFQHDARQSQQKDTPNIIPHFNAKGELIQTKNAERSAQEMEMPPATYSQYLSLPAIRKCRRFPQGCKGILLPKALGTACAKCVAEGHEPLASGGHSKERLKATAAQRSKHKPTSKFLPSKKVVKPKAREPTLAFIDATVPQLAKPPATSIFHDTGDCGLKVSLNPSPRDLSITTVSPVDAADVEQSSTPAVSESSETPFIVPNKRKPNDDAAGYSDSNKRRKSDILNLLKIQPHHTSNDEAELTHQEQVKSSNTFTGWDSDLTDLSSAGEEDSHSSETEGPSKRNRRTSGIKIRIPSLSSRKALATPAEFHDSSTDSGSRRKCSLSSCRHTLPEEYKWKLCKPCRVFRRDYQRSRNSQSVPKDDEPSTPISRDLQHVKEQSPSKTDSRSVPTARLPLRMFLHTPTYPQYQHLTPLIETFTVRLRDFMSAFMMWLQLAKERGSTGPGTDDEGKMGASEKLHHKETAVGTGVSAADEAGIKQMSGTKTPPISFSFEGEYSIIAPKELIPGSKGIEETWQRAERVVEELEKASGLQFQSTSSFGIQSGGMIMRFGCMHEIDVPLPFGPSSAKRPLVKPNQSVSASEGIAPPPMPLLSVTGIPQPDIPKTSEISQASESRELPQHTQAIAPRTIAGELEVASMPDRPAIRGNSAAVQYMSRYPSRYRGAYDYNYAYGEYDFGDRGAWSSPEHAYDEYDPRAGREPWQSPTSSTLQSAYADYYSEPRDSYSAPPSSQPAVSHDHRENTQLTRDDVPANHEPRNYGKNMSQNRNSRSRRSRNRRDGNSPRLTTNNTPVAPLSSSRAYHTSLHSTEPFTIQPTFSKPRSPTPPPPPPLVPDPEYISISLQPSTSSSTPPSSAARKLLILDLNGTLLIRPGRVAQPRPRYGTTVIDPSLRFRPVHPRPYLSTFRTYLFDERTRTWLDTMVWSSAQPHSVDDMVGHCFDSGTAIANDGDETEPSPPKRGRDNLVAVWARDTLGLSEADYNRKSQTTKDLAKPWAQIPTGTVHPHSALTTLLLDDSPLKAQLQPYNHVCIHEYDSTLRGADLETLANERRVQNPTEEDGKKRKRKAKKAQEARMRKQGEGECGSGSSVSSIDDIAPNLDSEAIPVLQTQSKGKYDETLLAVIGVLDNIRGQSNVAGWIRAGGLWGPNSSPPTQRVGSPSGNDAASTADVADAPPAMWFDDDVNLEYWAQKGRAVAESMGIPVDHGITG